MEIRFCFNFSLYLHLVIALVCIEETFESEAFKRLDFLIDLQEKITILWAGVIEIWLIYAHSPCPIGFVYHDRVCYPCGEHYFPDYASTHQIDHFGFNSPIMVCRLSSLLLFYKVTPMCCVKAMFYDLSIDAYQIRWLLGEDDGVMPQEHHQSCLGFFC